MMIKANITRIYFDEIPYAQFVPGTNVIPFCRVSVCEYIAKSLSYIDTPTVYVVHEHFGFSKNGDYLEEWQGVKPTTRNTPMTGTLAANVQMAQKCLDGNWAYMRAAIDGYLGTLEAK